jgi:hypothetical protein
LQSALSATAISKLAITIGEMTMNTNSKPRFSMRWLTGLFFSGTISLGLPAYADQNVTVDCASETIASAVANAAPGDRLTITVNGTCTENVTIERDQVTLKDGTVAGTGAVQPVIQILGARGIVIDTMTLQGGASHGIEATRNADVTITNSTMQNNALDGVRLSWGAFGDISGTTISGNMNCAVAVTNGAKVLLTTNTLTTAQPDIGTCSTIVAGRNATIFLNGSNTITNTDSNGFAMDIFQGSTVRGQPSTTTDTIMGDIAVDRLANADFRNETITGNISVGRRSWLRVRTPSGVTGDIFIDSDSTATFDGAPSPTINGTVTCGVSNATLVDPAGNVTVTGSGDLARVREGRAEGLITGGVFSNCNF